MLQELGEIGMELAREVGRRVAVLAEADDVGTVKPADDVGGLAIVFARVSRAVRQTIALETRVAEGHFAQEQKIAAETETLRAWTVGGDAFAARRSQSYHRERAKYFVEQAIEAEVPTNGVHDLLIELDERFGDYERFENIDDKPLGAIIADLCGQLGLNPDWHRWKDHDWAVEEARTAAKGSPYATPLPPQDEGAAGDRDDRAPERGPPSG